MKFDDVEWSTYNYSHKVDQILYESVGRLMIICVTKHKEVDTWYYNANYRPFANRQLYYEKEQTGFKTHEEAKLAGFDALLELAAECEKHLNLVYKMAQAHREKLK